MKKFLTLMLAILMVASCAAFAGCTNAPVDPAADPNADIADLTQDSAVDSDANKIDIDELDKVIEENNSDLPVDNDEVVEGDLKYIQDKGKIVVGITDYAPMNFKDENDEWTGFDTEFTKLVAEKLGVEVEFIEIDWDSKAMELEAKSIDCVWNGMTLTNEVLEAMHCSTPYAMNAQVVVMAADKLDSYKTVEDLADITFAAEAGSAGAAAIVDAGYEATEVQTQADALLEVAAGSADACVIDITMANAMTGEGTSYADLGYSISLTEEYYGIGFRKNSDTTIKVNEIMAELVADGTLGALAEKYEITLAK